MSQRLNRHQRQIVKRIIVRGTLVLDTPTCIGNGDADSLTDLALLRDSISDHALLTGSSIAGALRNYLRDYEHGYSADEQTNDLATTLFGGIRGKDDGEQSPLIVDDAISTMVINAELRDGVKINGTTATASYRAKYNIELITAGTEFPLGFELLIDRESDETALTKALAIALQGLERGEIGIGMKKRRGFGRCHALGWQVWQFDLQNFTARRAWLTLDREWANTYAQPPNTSQLITEALGITLNQQDKRSRFSINATFELASPLLIRSNEHSSKRTPDVVHLKSKRGNDWQPVVSGTSLAGVLCHRAVRIVKTLNNSQPTDREPEFIEQMFGFVEGKEAKASRLAIHESVVHNTTDLVQSRIAIDRFTGGAYHGALFNEQPIFGGSENSLKIQLELLNPGAPEIGLLLLLLKDLWTSDLPVGGESSIGRGRLQGVEATMTWHRSQHSEEWTISQKSGQLQVSDAAALEKFVAALVNHLGEAAA